MNAPGKRPYDLDGKEFAFWGQPNMDTLIDAAIAYARTGKLAVPDDIKTNSIPDPKRFIEFAVRGLATGTPVYMSNGEAPADPMFPPINYEHHKRSRELIDVIAKNVKAHVSTIHPDCLPKKNTGMSLG